MARPKGKLFALLAVFAAIGLVTATGAFTTVDAQRTVNVNVAGDGAALLELAPNSSSANGAYAETPNNELVINISTSNSNQGASGDFEGEGVNDNARTTIDHVFTITNQGTQAVTVSVDQSSLPAGFQLYEGTNNGTAISESLNAGESVSVSVFVNTNSFDGGSYTITITADAN